MRRGRRNKEEGFNLLELLVVMAIIMIVSALGIPAILQSMYRAKVEGAVRNVELHVRSARMNAIKRGLPVGVQIDLTNRLVFSYYETAAEPDGYTVGDDEIIGRLSLSQNIEFWGPGDTEPGGADASVGFDEADGTVEGVALFGVDGSVEKEGAYRLSDSRSNFFEVRVAPRATGRVTIRKWVGGDWRQQGENGVKWTWQH